MNTIRRWTAIAGLAWPLFSSFGQAPAVPSPENPGGTAPALSPSAAEVVRLAESNVSADVMQAFVHNSQTSYNLSAEDILYLKDLGISSEVVTAMLTRDKELRDQAPAPAPEPVAAPAPTAPPPPQPAEPPQAVQAPPPAYVSNPPEDVSYFYNDLSPYGTWAVVAGVGWCWQPRVVVISRGWQPYCDSGHWVFSDCGWCWTSDYSWGWAPFHYGRWYLSAGCGWVWVPGRVWSPAWVTWRSVGDHCGWAPLPPHADFDIHLGYSFNGVHVGLDFDFGLHPEHFTFVAVRDFNRHDFGRCRLAPVEARNIYTHTTVINNYVVNNNTIVNRGVAVEKVAAATHTQFHPAVLRDAPAGAERGLRVAGSQKTETVVYRPQLRAPLTQSHMVAQRLDSAHPVVQHQALATAKPAIRSLPPSVRSSPAAGRQAPPREELPPARVGRPPEHNTSPPARGVQETERGYAPTERRAVPSERTAPPRITEQPGRGLPQEPQGQQASPHVYYPKGYHQFDELHSAAPNNQRRASQAQPSGNSQPAQSKRNQ